MEVDCSLQLGHNFMLGAGIISEGAHNSKCIYIGIVFDERVTFFFCFNASGHCLVRVRMFHSLCVGPCVTIMQSHKHIMQEMHTHKAVTRRVEAKSYSLVEDNQSIVFV